MLGTIMEVMVILSCHPQLHLEQEDPYNLDLDSYIIQGCFQSKSCSKSLLNMVGTIMEVMVILSCHPQLHLKQEDPYNLDLDSNIIQIGFQSKSCSKSLLNMVGTIMEVTVILFENILGLSYYLDQDCRGPPAPNGVVDDRRG